MGAKRTAARVTLSVIIGSILFLGITVAAGVLSTYTENFTLHTLLELPFRWPRYVYCSLPLPRSGPCLYFNDVASLVTLIACDVIFYSLMVYSALWLWSLVRSKGKAKAALSAPPPPPIIPE